MNRRKILAGVRLLTGLSALTLQGRTQRMAEWGFVASWLYPILRRNSPMHGPVLTSFPTQAREVWLTIDDGPDAATTPGFLELLDARRAHASFFAIGRDVLRHPEISREIVAGGHTLENHTFSHPAGTWWALPSALVYGEMRRASEAISTTVGVAPRWFRNPVGMCPWGVHPAAASLGLRVAGWSAAGGDGCRRAPWQSLERILPDLRPGAIVVIHAGNRPRHRRLLLMQLLDEIERRELRCVLPEIGM